MTTPPGFDGQLRPYQERGLSWLSFLGGLGPGRRAWPTTWAWARRSRRCRSIAAERAAAAGPTLLVCPMSVVGNWQREAARFTPDLRVHVHHGADRLDGESLTQARRRRGPGPHQLRRRHRDQAALSQVTVGPGGLRRGAEHQEPGDQAGAGRAGAAGRPPDRADRHAGREPRPICGRSWSSSTRACSGRPAKFRRAVLGPDRAPRDDAAAPTRLKRLTGPFVLRRLKTDKTIIADLPDKLEMKVFCNLTPEQAALYAAVVDDMLTADRRGAEGIQRDGRGAGDADQAQAGLQPPGALARRQLAGCRAAPASWPGWRRCCEEMLVGRGRQGAVLHPVRRDGRDAAAAPAGDARPRGAVPARRHDQASSATRWWLSFQAALDEPALFLLSLKAGGTGLNLTAANHVFHVRPVVEPGGGGPGDRPGVPHRPDAATCRSTSSSASARWKRRSTR